MLYFAAAAIAAQTNKRNSSTVAKIPGWPLWRLILDEMAYAATQWWKRLANVLRRELTSGVANRSPNRAAPPAWPDRRESELHEPVNQRRTHHGCR